MNPPDDKKQVKRAANRRSAQLSRKRKKLYIEELKEENDELRRKEQILMSIPDLIVVFDSAGKLWFVSQAVNRFLDFLPEELEGSSFWDRLCEESVRLLKAAFMDALAARKNDMDTAPLGSGVWELRLVDKDGAHKVITLNGVVHFSGDAPECVCSIRPRDNKTAVGQVSAMGQPLVTAVTQASVSIRTAIKPNQSVIAGNISRDDASGHLVLIKAQANPPQKAAGNNGRLISDGDSGFISESGSE
jgi:PAS domain S-box-containing protein